MDANLSIPMLLLMGQQRDCIVFKDGTKRHLKLVGMLFDNVSVLGLINGYIRFPFQVVKITVIMFRYVVIYMILQEERDHQ